MGGKMKWKLAVSANCRRDRNSGFRLFPSRLDGRAPRCPYSQPHRTGRVNLRAPDDNVR
jgi:hypothetical protein